MIIRTSLTLAMALFLSAPVTLAGGSGTAGNVSVQLRGTNLIFSGDDGDNDIQIVGGAPGEVDLVGNGGTTINNLSDNVLFLGVTHIFLQMNSGDDTLLIFDLNIIGDITVEGGDDDDQVLVLGSHIGGDTTIYVHDGSDLVDVIDNDIDGDLTVVGGADNDVLTFFSNEIANQLLVRAGKGNDTLGIFGSTIGGETFVGLGVGDDVLDMGFGSTFTGDAYFDGGTGINFLNDDGSTIFQQGYLAGNFI